MYIFWWIFKTIRFCNLVVPNHITTTELIAALVLPKIPKIGCSTARKLIRHFESAEAVFQRIGRENSKPYNSIAPVFKRPEAKQLWGATKKEMARIKPQKATCITSGADVAQLVGWKKEKATAPQRQLFVRLNDKEQQIVKHMSATPKYISLINLDASLKILMFQGSFFNLK